MGVPADFTGRAIWVGAYGIVAIEAGMERSFMGKKRRRLRQEALLAVCVLLIVLCGVLLVVPPLLEDEGGEIAQAELTQKMVDAENIGELLGEHGVNIGESARIRALLRDMLPAGIFVNTFDITLNKLTVNYALTERSGSSDEEYAAFWQPDNAQQIIMYNTGAIFALVRNVEIVEINVAGYTYPTCILTRDEVEESLGVADMADIDTAEEWQDVLIDGGVYHTDTRRAFFAAHELVQNEPAE